MGVECEVTYHLGTRRSSTIVISQASSRAFRKMCWKRPVEARYSNSLNQRWVAKTQCSASAGPFCSVVGGP